MRHLMLSVLCLVWLCASAGAQESKPEVTVKIEPAAPVIEVQDQRTLGVLGATVDMDSGVILKVFQGSDLLNWQVRKGDQIVGINGRSYTPIRLFQECKGVPGNTVSLRIAVTRDGVTRLINYPITLVDVKVFKDQSPVFQKLYERYR